jgi:hypothetical protein
MARDGFARLKTESKSIDSIRLIREDRLKRSDGRT